MQDSSLSSNLRLFSIVLLLASHVEASGFFTYPVIDLNSAEKTSLSSNQDSTVVLFFEPDCSWCFKQSKVFNQYLEHCMPKVQFIGIGVNGNRQQLKKTAWKMKTQFPLYMASPDLLNATGKIPSTPLTLILNKQGNVLAHAKGYLPFKKWKATLSQYTNSSINCQG